MLPTTLGLVSTSYTRRFTSHFILFLMGKNPQSHRQETSPIFFYQIRIYFNRTAYTTEIYPAPTAHTTDPFRPKQHTQQIFSTPTAHSTDLLRPNSTLNRDLLRPNRLDSGLLLNNSIRNSTHNNAHNSTHNNTHNSTHNSLDSDLPCNNNTQQHIQQTRLGSTEPQQHTTAHITARCHSTQQHTKYSGL